MIQGVGIEQVGEIAEGRRQVHQAVVVRPAGEVVEQPQPVGQIVRVASLERRLDGDLSPQLFYKGCGVR